MPSRRSFLAGIGAAALPPGLHRAMNTATFKVSVITDEISQDFAHACQIASREFGLGWVASPVFKTDWPEAPKSKFSPAAPQYGADFTYGQQDELLERAFALAKAFGNPPVRIFDFWRLEDEKSFRQAIDDRLRRAAAAAARRGVVLTLENEHACNTATGAEAARLLNAIDDNALMLNWDPGNAAAHGETPFPDGYSKLPKERVAHMHLKDVQEPRNGKREWALMGKGTIDFVGQFRALKRDGYTGALSLETHWRGAGTPEESTRQCMAGLRALLDRAEQS
jgi:L-ribulose-5-phosphate 3-epimerase